MALAFTIKGNKTPPHDQVPCDTCEHAIRVRGLRLDDDLLFCVRLSERLSFTPMHCTCWEEKGTIPLYRLEQIAWNLLEDKRGNLIGFRSPSKTRAMVEEGKVERPQSVEDDF